MDLQKLIRDNIKSLKPYSTARDEFVGKAQVYLDANENPYNEPYNRYPDPYQKELKEKTAALKQVSVKYLFLGNGSDEPIDLLIRAFCEPARDNLVIFDPTYGMYEVAANINNVEVRKISLDQNFQVDPDMLLNAVDGNTKLIFLCSPNNPTGNCIRKDSVIKIIGNFDGLVVLDEAYIDFAPEKSFLPDLKNYQNLVILQTFSKAWGLAGARLGMAFAVPEIIQVLNKIKYPYNINILTQQKVLEAIENTTRKNEWVSKILESKKHLAAEMARFPFTIKVFPSDANFILVKMDDAKGIYDYLIEKEVVVRNRSDVHLCENCLRITAGNEKDNEILINTLKELL